MNSTESMLIGTLKAFATGSLPEINIDKVNFEELFELSRKHSVIGIVAYVLNKYDCFRDDAVKNKFMYEYDRTVMQMSGREIAAQKVVSMLNAMAIPHILFKGMKVSEAYPVPELRTYGDVDIIIRPDDVKRLCGEMKAQNYTHTVADAGVVNDFKKNREHYEFHTNLNVSNLKDSEYFSAIWENTVEVEGFTRRFNHNFHLSYLITHLEKHVNGKGAGLRMYLDIALYISEFADKINLEAVRDVLSVCGLSTFFNTVLYVCGKWFSLDTPDWVTPLDEITYEKFLVFTMEGGVFGERCAERLIDIQLRRKMNKGKRAVKFRVFIMKMFPPFSELCRLYPRYRGKPILAPVAWLNHLFRFFKDRKFSKVKEIVAADVETSAIKKDFLKSIGSSRD